MATEPSRGRLSVWARPIGFAVLLTDSQTERHPDLAIYQTSMPRGDDVWSRWIPEIVVEVVSPGSKKRDYVEKREEYLEFGVQEYWILDAGERRLLAPRRAGADWKELEVRPPQFHETPLLPGLRLDVQAISGAAASA